jgi:hypothetical protein
VKYYRAWNMLALRLQRWVAEKNDWAKMLQVDAMVPCMDG